MTAYRVKVTEKRSREAGKTISAALMCLLVIVLSGCSGDSVDTRLTGKVGRYERLCIDGVEYLYLDTGYGKQLAAHFKPDGSLFVCN